MIQQTVSWHKVARCSQGCHDTVEQALRRAVGRCDKAERGHDTVSCTQGRAATCVHGLGGRVCCDTINCIMTGERPGR